MKRIVIAILLVACGGQPHERNHSSDAGLSADARMADGRAADSGHADTAIAPLPDNVCVAADPDKQLESECCIEAARREPGANAATVIDLRDAAATGNVTCGYYESNTLWGYDLPDDPNAYPVKVILPAVSGRDPACAATCSTDGASGTAFGIGMAPKSALLNQYAMAIYVPPPWKMTSGGCGEACAWPCLEGYQEYGVRSCTTIFHGEFGFATADLNAPSVEAIIELVEQPAPGAWGESHCCLLE